MATAYSAWDLRACSNGRFILGLGTQIKAHIERRYSMEWSQPVARMREYVAALRAIWESWQEGSPLSFRGDFYTHTLMTPMFSPGATPYGPPPVYLAGVGDSMVQLAAEVGGGLLVHPFTTEKYLRSAVLENVDVGLDRARRSRSEVDVVALPLVVTGNTEEEMATRRNEVRKRIAFYGSTPAYRGVLELHGWGDLQADLHALARRGSWDEMGNLIDDEVLDAFALVAEPGELAARVRDRFGGLADRVALNTAGITAFDRTGEIVRGFRASTS
jgi:probable F420-dependent oxidoreductase